MPSSSGQESRLGICRRLHLGKKVLSPYQRDSITGMMLNLAHWEQRSVFQRLWLAVSVDLGIFNEPLSTDSHLTRRQMCEQSVVCSTILTKNMAYHKQKLWGEYPTPMVMLLFPQKRQSLCISPVAMQLRFGKDRECKVVPMLNSRKPAS